MEIAKILGWECCVVKGSFKVGDKAVFFPPDSVLSLELSIKLGVTKYLRPVPKNKDGEITGWRVRVSKLRGFESYGFIMECDQDIPKGYDMAEELGVYKYEEPIKDFSGQQSGQQMVSHPLFSQYTDIDNIKKYPNVFKDGEEVVMTEKCHGTNSRISLLESDGSDDEQTRDGYTIVVGSRTVRKKQLGTHDKVSLYWMFVIDEFMDRFHEYRKYIGAEKSIILFGEIFGSGIQDMTYGNDFGTKQYSAFDIKVDDKWLDFDEKTKAFEMIGVARVPVLYRGGFSQKVLDEHTTGPTIICDHNDAGKFKGREGIVVTPVKEEYSMEIQGRKILKSISFDYLNRKRGTEHH